MSKILAFLNAFRKGQVVVNPEAWKKGEIGVGVLTAFLVSAVGLAKAFGFEIPVSEGQLYDISLGILAAVSIFFPVSAVVSSEKVGLSTKDKSATESAANILGK
jgi:hypothetical protein